MSKPPIRLEPGLPRTRISSLAEHEILFSFNDDAGAEAFSTWWELKGLDLFLADCRDDELLKDIVEGKA